MVKESKQPKEPKELKMAKEPKEPKESKEAKASVMSTRDMELLMHAWGNLKSNPEIDYDKFAAAAGYKNGHTARTQIGKVLAKARTIAAGSGSKPATNGYTETATENAEGENATDGNGEDSAKAAPAKKGAGARKRKPATNSNVEEEDGTAADPPKKRRAPKNVALKAAGPKSNTNIAGSGGPAADGRKGRAVFKRSANNNAVGTNESASVTGPSAIKVEDAAENEADDEVGGESDDLEDLAAELDAEGDIDDAAPASLEL